jgi:hypothetical protein
LLPAAVLLCPPARALSMDSRSQLHAVIGQPLSVDLPVSFAGINANAVTVRVTPGPELPDEEASLAEAVQASYDAERSIVHLSTAQRLMVPAISLHLTVTAGALVLNQDVDVLLDVPDLKTQRTARPAPPARRRSPLARRRRPRRRPASACWPFTRLKPRPRVSAMLPLLRPPLRLPPLPIPRVPASPRRRHRRRRTPGRRPGWCGPATP